MHNRETYKIDSTIYLIGLFVLFLNDFFLKSIFHNWITGKLSDLVGLFLITAFLLNVTRVKPKTIEIIVIISFVLWKHNISQGFIEWWSTNFYNISRQIDYTDLICLIVVPMTKKILTKSPKRVRINPVFPFFISIFLFGATSYDNNIKDDKSYHFEVSGSELKKHIKHLEFIDTNFSELSGDSIKLCVIDSYCFESFNVYAVLKEAKSSNVQLEVISYNHSCQSNSSDIYGIKQRNDKKELSEIFQTKIIKPLKNKIKRNKK